MMIGVPTGAGNYPPGVTDADPHFDALDEFTSEHPRAERITVCDDCGRTCYTGELAKQLAQIERLGERLDPGAEVPAGDAILALCHTSLTVGMGLTETRK
jgi:hypothetical protein